MGAGVGMEAGWVSRAVGHVAAPGPFWADGLTASRPVLRQGLGRRFSIPRMQPQFTRGPSMLGSPVGAILSFNWRG